MSLRLFLSFFSQVFGGCVRPVLWSTSPLAPATPDKLTYVSNVALPTAGTWRAFMIEVSFCFKLSDDLYFPRDDSCVSLSLSLSSLLIYNNFLCLSLVSSSTLCLDWFHCFPAGDLARRQRRRRTHAHLGCFCDTQHAPLPRLQHARNLQRFVFLFLKLVNFALIFVGTESFVSDRSARLINSRVEHFPRPRCLICACFYRCF